MAIGIPLPFVTAEHEIFYSYHPPFLPAIGEWIFPNLTCGIILALVGSLWSVASVILLKSPNTERNRVGRMALPAVTLSVVIVVGIFVSLYTLGWALY